MKDPIFSKESDQADVINIDNKPPTVINLLNKVNQIKDDLGGRGVNTRQRVQGRRQLLSKAGSNCTIDQDATFIPTMARKTDILLLTMT